MSTSDRGFDFSDFFHLFMDSFVANLRDCLLEWLQAALSLSSPSSSPPCLPSLAPLTRSPELLPGEVAAFCFEERVHSCVFGGKGVNHQRHAFIVPAQLLVTNYRIILTSLRSNSHKLLTTALTLHHRKPPPLQLPHSRFDLPSFFERMSLPLGLVQRISCGPPRNSVFLHCKDFRTLRITLSGIEVGFELIALISYSNSLNG